MKSKSVTVRDQRSWAAGLAVLLAALAGCGTDAIDPGGHDAGLGKSTDFATSGGDAAASSDSGGCRTDKMKFTDCRNDGSVEFCVPLQLAPFIRTSFPTLQCNSDAGPAACNLMTEKRCVYPTLPPDQCTTVHGALTPLAMSDLCGIAGYPEVVEIVPTILE